MSASDSVSASEYSIYEVKEEIKILIVGDGNVGKTAFVNSIVNRYRHKLYSGASQWSRSVSCGYGNNRFLTLVDCDEQGSFFEKAHVDNYVYLYERNPAKVSLAHSSAELEICETAEKNYWANVKYAIIMVDYNSKNTGETIQKYATKVQTSFPGVPMVVVYNKMDLYKPGTEVPDDTRVFNSNPELKESFDISITHNPLAHRLEHVVNYVLRVLVKGDKKQDLYWNESERINVLESTVARLETVIARLTTQNAELTRSALDTGIPAQGEESR